MASEDMGFDIVPNSQDEVEQQQPVEQGEGQQAHDFVSSLVLNVFVEQVQQQLTAALVPAAGALSKSVVSLQSSADQVTAVSNAEQQEVEAEAARVKGLVAAFKESILMILGPTA